MTSPGWSADASVGENKTVFIDGLTIPTGVSEKYDISWPATTTASITPKAAEVKDRYGVLAIRDNIVLGILDNNGRGLFRVVIPERVRRTQDGGLIGVHTNRYILRLSAMGGSGSGAIQWSIKERSGVATIDSDGVVTVTGTGGFTVEAYREAADVCDGHFVFTHLNPIGGKLYGVLAIRDNIVLAGPLPPRRPSPRRPLR